MSAQSATNHLLASINNVRLVGQTGLWQLKVAEGKISAISPQPDQLPTGAGVLDAQGGLAQPPLSSRIFIWIPLKQRGNRAGINQAPCLRV